MADKRPQSADSVCTLITSTRWSTTKLQQIRKQAQLFCQRAPESAQSVYDVGAFTFTSNSSGSNREFENVGFRARLPQIMDSGFVRRGLPGHRR
jgi:hypothetical protein